MKFSAVVAVLSLLALPALAAHQIEPNRDPLFQAKDILSLRLEAPFADLFSKIDRANPENSKKHSVEGRLFVGEKNFRVSIRMRGNSTMRVCKVPKLALDWKKADAEGTPFEGLGKIDLGTHCMSKEEFAEMKDWTRVYAQGMQFPYREHMVYDWAKILGIATYSTRRAEITYADTSTANRRALSTDPAIFIESFGSLLKRARAVEIRPEKDLQKPHDNDPKVKKIWNGAERAELLDRDQLARAILFQNLLGNVDWQLKENLLWNLRMMEMPNGQWLMVPEDFNLTGIALGMKADHIPWSRDSFKYFHLASKQARLDAIEDLEAKRQELINASASLGHDPEGKRFMMETLDSKFAFFAQEKDSIARE